MDTQEGECAEELPDEPLLAPPAFAARAALLLARNAKIHVRRGACPGLPAGRYGCRSALCFQVCFPVVATLLVTLLPRVLIKALVVDSDAVFREEVQPQTFHNPWPGLPLRMDGDVRRSSNEARLSPHFARYKQLGHPPVLGLHAVEGAQSLHDLLFAQTRLPWQCHCKTLAITGHRGSAEAFKQYVQRQYAAWEAAARSRGLSEPANATATVLLDTKVSEGESAWLGCDADAGHAGPLFRLFPSSSAIDAWIGDPKYGAYARDRTEASPIDRLCGAVVFENDATVEPEPRYTIRTNITASGKTFGYKDTGRYGDLADLSQFLTRPGADFMPDNRRDDAGSFMWYQYSGFLSLQHLAHGFLAERAGSASTRDILQGEPRFMPMPLDEARFPKYREALASFATHPLLLALQFSPGVAMLAYYLCRERSAQHRQLLRTLGCSRASSVLSWLVLFMLLNLAAALPCAVVVRQTCFWHSSPSVLFVAYYLFACGTGIMGLTAAALAPNARVGVAAALGLVLSSSLASVGPFDAPSIKLCASLLPTTALRMILDALLLLEGSGGGCTWATLSRRVGNFSVARGLGMLLLDLPLWFCLYCCLDYLLPWDVQGGAQERWRPCDLPCFAACSRRSRRQPPASPSGDAAEPTPGLFEPEDEPRLQDLLEKDRCVVASGLTKDFEGPGGVRIRAVDGLSLRMYDSECACLLGHNGAGKTTALSLLVGGLGPTRGFVRVLGVDPRQDLRHARSASGFCPQQTVLFDELTAAEHLALVSHLRMAPSAAAAATEVGEECFLDMQPARHAGCLSSSARRKLTVALALVGRPKFVVLDEPSDGMDPASRCGLWRVLRARRQNCILCVSTHSMMEAEALGDRLAVLSEGRLVCGGSPAFLTRTYRCGYVLSFVRRGALPDAAILELVREHCGPLAEISSAMGKELRVQVPFEEAASFPKLFDVLDKRRDFLGVETFSVSMTSFEAVFAKFGHSASAMEQALKRPATLLRPSRSRPVFQSQGSWVPPLQTELPERTDSPTWHITVNGDVGETPRPDTSLGASPVGSPLGSWTSRTSCSPRTPRDEAGMPMTSGWAARSSLEPPDERTPGGHGRASSRTPRAFTPGRAPRTPREGETPRGGRGLLPLGVPREELPRGTFTPGRAPRTPRDLAGEGTPTSRGRAMWTPRGGTPRGGTPRATTPRGSAQKAQDANSDVGQRKVQKAKPASFLFQLLVLSKRRVKCGLRDPKMLGLRLLLPSLCPVVFACLASHHDAAPPPKVLDTSSWNMGVEGSRVPVAVAVEEASGAQLAGAAEEAWLNWTPPGVDDVHFSRALNASSASFASLDPEVLGLAADQLPQLRAEKAFVDLLLSGRGGQEASHYGAVLYPRERYLRRSQHGATQNGTCRVTTHQGEGSILKECLAATPVSSIGPTIFANLSAYHAAPTLFNIHASALLRAHTRGSLQRVEVVNHPFQRTAHEASRADSTDGLILALSLVLVWSFLPASVASHAVMEREAGVKHQLLVSGSSQAAYWLSNLVFDYLLVLASVVAMFLVLIVCQQGVGGLLEVPGVLGLTVMALLYGFTATSSSYLLFVPLFSKPGAAAWGTFAASVVLGSSATITVFALQSGGSSTLDYAAEVLASFFRLVPSCALGLGALLIGRNHRLAKHVGISAFSGWWTGGMHCPTASAYTWDCTYMVGDEVWMLALQALLFSGLTVVLGCASELRAWRRFRVQGARKLPSAEVEDTDVVAETQRVAGLNPRTEIICVNGLSKVFGGGRHAVRGVSFASAEGEVFGVLGPNGAGKTTLLRMLCGELLPSAGRLHLRGLDVVDCVSDVRRLLGYCPQHDPLLESLTVQEHLSLHSGLRGASACGPESEVQRHLAQFGLSAFHRWRAGQLSGGNKRKLSVALACIAEPPLLFLDEPSVGMDPAARRGLWAALHGAAEARRRSVVLLATHSPEEAESLCSRIAIQAEGIFRGLGSAQRIRSCHNRGLELSVHLVPPTAKDVESHFQGDQDFDDATRISAEALLLRSRRERLEALLTRELGPEAGGEKGFRLLEASGCLLRYEILQKSAERDARPFSEVFRVLEESRDELMLEDLHLSHGSLAQAVESVLAADGKTQARSHSATGATAARGAGREKFVAVDMSTRVMSDSAFSDSEMGEMTVELDMAAEGEPRSQTRALI